MIPMLLQYGFIDVLTGGYIYQFTSPGLYYYWSAPIDSYGQIILRGVVKVHQKSSVLETLTLTVNGHAAIHNTTSGKSPHSS